MHHDVKVIPSVVSILSWFRAVMLDTVIAWLTNMHCFYNVIYWYCSIAMGVDLCLVRLRCFALCASIESVCILESVCSSLCALWCAVIQSFSSCNHPPWPHTDPPITLRKISSEKKRDRSYTALDTQWPLACVCPAMTPREHDLLSWGDDTQNHTQMCHNITFTE